MKQQQQQQQQTNVGSHARAFLEEKNAPKIQVKFLKMPQEDSFPSQAADYKTETQLQTRPPTDILHKPHPDLELYLYVLEIHEHLLFKKLAPNGCFLKKKKKTQKQNKTKTKKEEEEQQQQKTTKQ